MLEAKQEWFGRTRNVFDWNPKLRIGKPARVEVLFSTCRFRLRGPVLVCGVNAHARGPVIVRLHHLAFVQRDEISLRTAVSVATDGIRSYSFPLGLCAYGTDASRWSCGTYSSI